MLNDYGNRTERCSRRQRHRLNYFLETTFNLLEENKFPDIISWDEQGDHILIKDAEAFSNTVLPQAFSHANFASFVRQLHMYYFRKTIVTNESNSYRYYHPSFRRGQRELLFQIKRRPAGNKKAQLSEAKTPEIDCELEEFEKSPYKMIKQDQPEVDMRTLNELRKKNVAINEEMQAMKDQVLELKQQMLMLHQEKLELHRRLRTQEFNVSFLKKKIQEQSRETVIQHSHYIDPSRNVFYNSEYPAEGSDMNLADTRLPFNIDVNGMPGQASNQRIYHSLNTLVAEDPIRFANFMKDLHAFSTTSYPERIEDHF